MCLESSIDSNQKKIKNSIDIKMLIVIMTLFSSILESSKIFSTS